MAVKQPGEEWLRQVHEPIIDPERIIVDPHHHLWERPGRTYLLEELWADTDSGHKVTKTVFLECGASYHEDGPEHFKPVGETVFVEAIASASRAGTGAEIAGIVAHADLTSPHLDEALDAHEEAGKGLFRGIRHSLARDPHPEALSIPGRSPEGLAASETFRHGLARLGERGYTYDGWHYHHQNLDFRDLAKAAPGTTMVLDHFGTPLGVGPYADKREEIFAQWRDDIAAIAECPNVVAKLGGLAMPDNGFGWDRRTLPASSEELLEAQARWYHHTIKCFGAHRCMFESNFPVDRLSISYHVLWNGLKKIAASYSEEEKTALFSGTATRVYNLD
ncbi:MAG: amidohydrolase family protein [Opitutae bacterium]|nr:amidohydrolase family protein [Opitutae bacterium]MBC9890123.1 amidohydrolase family protein [Opitutae bacterium]